MVQNLGAAYPRMFPALSSPLGAPDLVSAKQPIRHRALSFWVLLPSCLVLGKHGRACPNLELLDRYGVPTVPDLREAMDPGCAKQPIPHRTASFWVLLPSCLVLGEHNQTCQNLELLDRYGVLTVPDL